MSQPFSIAIHGGAGTILRDQMSDRTKGVHPCLILKLRFAQGIAF